MKKSKLLIFALIAIAVMLLICGCNKNEAGESTLKIATPFVDLEYPESWGDKFNAEWVGNDDSGAMIFSMKYNEILNVELFQIHFNEDAQIPSGVLKSEKGEIRVGISFAEAAFSDSWSDAEKDTFYAMQEDANFIIRKLSENKKFKAN